MRLTKALVQKILDENEGITKETHYTGRNITESNIYKITGGKLLRRSVGKTSWADSRYDTTIECDMDQTRRFIRKFIDLVDYE